MEYIYDIYIDVSLRPMSPATNQTNLPTFDDNPVQATRSRRFGKAGFRYRYPMTSQISWHKQAGTHEQVNEITNENKNYQVPETQHGLPLSISPVETHERS